MDHAAPGRRILDHTVAVVYAVVCLVVVVAPAVAVRWAGAHGGMGSMEGMDLVAASSVLGAVQAVMAWSRLRCEVRTALRRADMWIASLNALVVLTLGATLLLVLVLHGFADEHASLANKGYPVVALWAGVQAVAIGLAELTGRVVFWWLEPRAESRHVCRWSVFPPLRHAVRRRPALAPALVPASDRTSNPATT